MKEIDKNTKWWIGQEREWAFQDKNGEWWLIKDEKEKKKIEKKMSNIPAQNIVSMAAGVKKLLIFIVLACLIGASLGFNIIQYLKVKSLENVIFQEKIIKSSSLDHRDQSS